MGRIHPIKNLLFLLEILEEWTSDEIKLTLDSSKRGNDTTGISLTIAATMDDKAYWEKCQQKISTLKKRITIHIHLDSPHQKIRSLLQSAHLFFLPTEGENFGHAIFEALSVGCPVLISDQTPWKELQSKKAGLELSLSDRDGFINALKNFTQMDDYHWQEFRKGAWSLANDYQKKLDAEKTHEELFSSTAYKHQ